MRYEAPSSLEEAVALLSGASGDARVLAGGTDLLVQMRSEQIQPDLVVDVKAIAEMRQIVCTDGRFRIGAAVSLAELAEDAALREAWPGVVEAAELIGSTQIQGRATLGGNLCNASPAADSAVALVAAGAVARVAAPAGRYEAPAEEIAIGPGQTSLARGEVVVSFELSQPPPHSGDAYVRFTPRTEMDIAVVGAGVVVSLDESGACVAARVALGAVAERILIVPEASETLVGTVLDAADLERLAEAASAACRPIDDKRGTKAFRVSVAGVLARRAARSAFERARRSR
jgi:carbon-monoxide dehydrogenase medium subunit